MKRYLMIGTSSCVMKLPFFSEVLLGLGVRREYPELDPQREIVWTESERDAFVAQFREKLAAMDAQSAGAVDAAARRQ